MENKKTETKKTNSIIKKRFNNFKKRTKNYINKTQKKYSDKSKMHVKNKNHVLYNIREDELSTTLEAFLSALKSQSYKVKVSHYENFKHVDKLKKLGFETFIVDTIEYKDVIEKSGILININYYDLSTEVSSNKHFAYHFEKDSLNDTLLTDIIVNSEESDDVKNFINKRNNIVSSIIKCKTLIFDDEDTFNKVQQKAFINGAINNANVIKLDKPLPRKAFDTNNKLVNHILVYAGNFYLNGITTSFSNLLSCTDLSQYEMSLFVNIDAPSGEKFDKKKFLEIASKSNVFLFEQCQIIDKIENPTEELLESYESYKKGQEISEEHLDIFNKAYEQLAYKLLNNVPVDTLLDYSGYNVFISNLFANAQTKYKKIIYMHSDMIRETKVRKKFKNLQITFRNLKNFDYIVSVSVEINKKNKKIADEYFVKKEKFVYINNAIDVQYVLDRCDEPISDNENVMFNSDLTFVNVGRYSKEKGQEMLINVFSKAIEQNKDKNLKLILIGYGDDTILLENKIQELGLSDNIILTGKKDNPYKYMKKSDCYVSSSMYEGQGLTIFEANISGIPVIATNAKGNVSAVKFVDGRLVKNDEDSLLFEINEFIECPFESTISDYEKYELERATKFDKIFGDTNV